MSDRALAIYFGTFAVVLVLGIAFFLRPSVVLGVDGDSLGDSVNGHSELGSVTKCSRSGDLWECELANPSGGGATYEVSVDGWGCWTGKRGSQGPSAERGAPQTIEGCINLLDH